MTDANIAKVLTELRQVAVQSGLKPATSEQTGADSFASLLKASLDQINTSQQRADTLARALESGESGVDISAVMVEMQKARISFEAAVQVRNRLISAYQDIMNMPL